MANTFELIASSTVGSGGASAITFSSIPSTYTDLSVALSVRSGASFTRRVLALTFNGSTNDYSDRYLLGNGSAASSGTDSYPQANILIWDAPAATATANTFSNINVYIPNYASTSTYKSVSNDGAAEDNATAGILGLAAGLYSLNTAISSISFAVSGNFVQYSTAYLFGIKSS
jgi:hypothetical protein